MNVKVKTDYFITLAEAKVQLRVEPSFTAEDSHITQLIKAATGFAENYIDKDIASTTNTATLQGWSGNIITINEGNYRSVTSVTGETSGLISSGNYEVKYEDSCFTITLDNSISDEDMTIVFETGYILSTYPFQIRQWVLSKIVDLYDTNRGSYHLNVLKTDDKLNGLLDYFVAMKFKKDSQ